MTETTPTSPVKASHRILRYLAETFHKDDHLDPRPEQLDIVCRVFLRAGGSWVRLYGGSARDVDILKRVFGVAVKTGRISKAPNWGDRR